jgi:uncharacterized protein YlxW (UPF0749 family)
MKPSTKFGILLGILSVTSPLIFIWSVNTLFNVGIPFSLKTWFAGLLLLYVVKYHMRGARTSDDSLFFKDYRKEEIELKKEKIQDLEEKVKRLDEQIETLEKQIEENEMIRTKKKSRS